MATPVAPSLLQTLPALELALLNPWQRGFPLCDEPFAVVGAALDLSAAQVLQAYRQLAQEGALSRIGAVFAPGSGGASILSAMAVPPERLEAVAAVVSAHPGVNHNYERENAYNLWFVVTGPSAAQVECTIASLEADTGLTALRLFPPIEGLESANGQPEGGFTSADRPCPCSTPELEPGPSEWTLVSREDDVAGYDGPETVATFQRRSERLTVRVWPFRGRLPATLVGTADHSPIGDHCCVIGEVCFDMALARVESGLRRGTITARDPQ